MNAKVYRSGTVAAPAQRGVEAQSYLDADAVKPAGRQGRTTAIFASPNLRGVLRWVVANTSLVSVADPFVKEITVDPDTVWVYNVAAWERTSLRENYETYWETGMTLAEWNNTPGLDPTEWELLLGADDVRSVRPVSDKRVLSHVAEDDLWSAESIAKLLKAARKK